MPGAIPSRFHRRQVLQVGGLGLMGVTLPRLLKAESRAAATSATAAADPLASRARADNCILIFLDGGPSHLDMWDMKPDAPDSVRGEFKPISTTVPGLKICELLPRLARQMHRATLVRSMNHSVNNSHGSAVYTALTGHDRGENGGGTTKPHDYPCLGAVMQKLRPPTARGVVPHVTLPYKTQEGAGNAPQPGFFGGFFGPSYDPLFVLKDPNAPNFSLPELTLPADVPAKRLGNRLRLLGDMGGSAAVRPCGPAPEALDSFQMRAFDLLTSGPTRRAFQIAEERDVVRDSYGRNIYGQSVLLARRLIEAGTRVTTVSWAPDANSTWDTHGQNFTKLRGTLLPQFDAAISSLITDLADRGMLDRTLVAVMGDFGRSPRINKDAGRDHWNHCYSLMMVGGGFAPGLVFGASDRTGALPVDRPLTPADMICTIYHTLGIAPEGEITDRLDRPQRVVPAGNIVPELLA